MFKSTYSPAINDSLIQCDLTVNMTDPWQVLFVCRELSITKTQLEAAVRGAGTDLRAVRQYFGA